MTEINLHQVTNSIATLLTVNFYVAEPAAYVSDMWPKMAHAKYVEVSYP